MERLGRYELVEEIGKGGMAVVYRARDTAEGRDVALKVIHDERADDPHHRRRLLREAKAASAIDHPAVCEVYDVGTEDGRVYIAMELLEGETLRSRIGTDPLDPAEALDHAVALADVVARAHALGVVHRDIKPDNVMLTARGLKLLDFGIARQTEEHIPVSEAETALTREGAIVGTPGYMAPEQMLGFGADERSDIFSIGVTVYAMLTGRLPFGGQSLMEIAVNVVRDEPAPLSTYFRSAWSSLDQTMAACLAKDPEERLGSASELRDRLQTHRDEWLAGPPSLSLPPTERAPSPRRPLWWAAGLAAGAAAVVGWALWADAGGDDAAPPSATAAPTAIAITDLPLPDPSESNEQARVAFGRALAAFRDGSWGRAKSELELALEHDPNLPAAHLRLALFHGASGAGEPTEARRAYQRAASMRAGLTPRDQALLQALEPMFARTPPDMGAARDRLRELTESRPRDAELSFLAAWSALSSGDGDDALALARRAVALDPDYADPWQAIGNVLMARGDDIGAEEPLRRCAALSPASADCLADLTEVKGRMGDCDAALDLARQFSGRVADHASHRTLAWALAGAGAEPAAVKAAVRRAARDDGDRLRNAIHDLRVMIWSGALQEALDKSHEALALAETNDDLARHAEPAMLQVHLLEELEGAQAASKAAKAFLDRTAALVDAPLAKVPRDPTMEMWRIRFAAGDVTEQELEEARDRWLDRWRARSNDETSIWLGGRLRAVHDAEGARDALASRPAPESWHEAFRYPQMRAVLGRAQLLAGDVDAAIETLGVVAGDCRVYRAPFAVVRAQLWLGQALEKKGDGARACEAYEGVMARWAASPETRTHREAAERAKEVCDR